MEPHAPAVEAGVPAPEVHVTPFLAAFLAISIASALAAAAARGLREGGGRAAVTIPVRRAARRARR
jgi:hypothetical protein